MNEDTPQQNSPPTIPINTPHRARRLALEDWADFKSLSPAQFTDLLDRLYDDSIIQRPSYEATLIERACLLIFILIGSGGACVPGHLKLIEKLRIDTSAALLGFIRWPPRRCGKRPGPNHNTVAGPRQFLHLLGRLHLKAYIGFRLNSREDQAQNGDMLLPPLSSELVKKAAQHLTWLQDFPHRITWNWVYHAWLRYRLSSCYSPVKTMDKEPAAASAQALTELALWRLLPHELPLLLEARRGRLLTSPLPDDYLARFLPQPFPAGIETKQGPVPLRKRSASEQTGTVLDTLTAIVPASGEKGFGSREEAFSQDDFDGVQGMEEDLFDLRSESDSGVEIIRGWLRDIIDQNKSDREAINEARALLCSNLLRGPSPNDLHLILKWAIAKLEQPKHSRKRNRFSTVFSYATRLLTVLEGLVPVQLTQLSTLDLAAFLSDYATANTAKAYKAAIHGFYSFLVKEGLASENQIDFKSRSLHFSEGYRERELITEEGFRRALSTACRYKKRFGRWLRPVLILLRRAGLRCGEVTALTPRDFHGMTECRLFVRTSKTKAGKRALPLYLLLSRRELQVVTTFVATAQRERGADANLVVAPDGSHIQPEALSRQIRKLLRAGGVYFETAHGLRHAFASGLLAAWWLRMTEGWPEPKDLQTNSWTRNAILSFGRPDIEGRAVEHADDLRRLLGHADLAVTFERYIHILDLITADVIRLAESCSEPHRMPLSQAAQLIGVTDRAVRQRFTVTERREPVSGSKAANIILSQVEDWLDVRLVRAACRASHRSHSP